jgi:hypothetical protein
LGDDIAPTLNTTAVTSDIIFTGNVRTNPQTSVTDQSYRQVTFDANAAAFTFWRRNGVHFQQDRLNHKRLEE